MRLIDADAILADDYTHVVPYGVGKAAGRIIVFTEDIENAPTIDAEPIRHGHWIEKEKYAFGILYDCSLCENRILDNGHSWNFCPNCGAKMDEENNK